MRKPIQETTRLVSMTWNLCFYQK